jgi:Ca-activated chloride channel family protein
MPKVNMPNLGGNKGGAEGSGDNANDARENTSGGVVEIPFVITAAKKDWVGEQVDRFNSINQDKWRIVTKPVPSREAMHGILAGNIKPVMWSPGSPVWPARLAEAYSQQQNKTILDLSDPNAYRVFLRSPLVFLTTRRKAPFLRPLLGGTDPWGALRQLSTGQRKTPWGGFRFSHADPLTSSSGVMTMGLILFDYAQKTGQTDSLAQVAVSKPFITYMRELDRSLVYDKPAREGTTKLTNAFLEDSGRYDVITAYESAALAAAPRNPDIAVIYPNPTAVSEHAVTLLNAEWVSEEQRQGALAFLQFLGSKESLQGGLKYYFRPAQSGSSLSLAPVLSRYNAQGFKDSFATVELPPYEALNAASYQWHNQVIKQRQF